MTADNANDPEHNTDHKKVESASSNQVTPSCDEHPDRKAERFCTDCERMVCAACIETQENVGHLRRDYRFAYVCVNCRGACVPLDAEEESEPPTFWSRLKRELAAPFRRGRPEKQQAIDSFSSTAPRVYYCDQHTIQKASRFCVDCGHVACDRCIEKRENTGFARSDFRFAYICRECRGACVPIRNKEEETSPSFQEGFKLALRAPLSRRGIFVWMIGLLVFLLMDLLMFMGRTFSGHYLSGVLLSRWLNLVIGCPLLLYGLRTIRETALGVDGFPPGRFVTIWQSFIKPIFRFTACLAVSFGPILAVSLIWLDLYREWILFFLWGEDVPVSVISMIIPGSVASLTGLFGIIYFPMSIVAVSILQDVKGSFPHYVLPAILRISHQYIFPVAFLMFIFLGMGLVPAMSVFTQTISQFIEQTVSPSWVPPETILTIGGTILVEIVLVYLCLVEAKLLGYLYRCHRKTLGWLE